MRRTKPSEELVWMVVIMMPGANDVEFYETEDEAKEAAETARQRETNVFVCRVEWQD